MSSRLCPNCGASEAIETETPIWPIGWRCGACGYAVPVIDGFPEFAPALANSLTGMDPASFEELSQHEDGHFWFEPRNRLLVGLADRYFPKATRYLEIGCGTGAVLAPMAERGWSRLAGAEIHPAGLMHARRRLSDRAEFIQMDARKIPARSAFDLIGAYDVLEHIEEDEQVIGEVYAALVPGGGFIAAVPQHPVLWSRADDIAFHVRRYRRGELERKLRHAGFNILFSSSYTTFLLPLMAASRLMSIWRRDSDAHAIVQREFDIHPAINAALRSALSVEAAMTLKGISWPLGGSRVVVAQR